jgi:hypothetical protein
LVVTGDFSRDELRRANRVERLGELAGLRWVGTPAPLPARGNPTRETIELGRIGLPPQRLAVHLRGSAADGEVLARRADGSPVLVRRALGRGTVVYLASPIELDDGDEARAFRRRFYGAMFRDAAARSANTAGPGATAADVAPLTITPDDPRLHVLRQPTTQGTVHVVCNTKPVGAATDVEISTAAGPIGLRVPDGWPVLAAVGNDGRLVAAGSAGAVRCRGAVVAESTGLCTLLALDGADLARSEAILVAPSAEGAVRFPGRTGAWTALVGEFRDGRWITRERLDPADPAAPIALDADRATCVTVFCRRGTDARWTELLGRAMVRPETLPRW